MLNSVRVAYAVVLLSCLCSINSHAEIHTRGNSMMNSEEYLKEIIHYDAVPAPPATMKPGFFFNSHDYPLLDEYEVIRDNIYGTESSLSTRSLMLKMKESIVYLTISVSSKNSEDARELMLSNLVSEISMSPDVFALGSLGIGEFSVVRKAKVGESSSTVGFARNNIGVKIFSRDVEFNTENFARQIDGKILKQKDYDKDALQKMVPVMKEVRAPVKVKKDTSFKVAVEIDQEQGKDIILYEFEYNDEMLAFQDQSGPTATFRGLKKGETVVHCVVVRKSDLLSNSRDVKVMITDK